MPTQRISRRIKAPRAAVYRALLDPQAIAAWRVPDGMTSHVHAFEPRAGGCFRVSLSYEAAGATGFAMLAREKALLLFLLSPIVSLIGTIRRKSSAIDGEPVAYAHAGG